MSKKERIVQILRIIMPMVGIICIVIFSPWDGIWAWTTPVPNTVQEQVDDVPGYGLDGIILLYFLRIHSERLTAVHHQS